MQLNINAIGISKIMNANFVLFLTIKHFQLLHSVDKIKLIFVLNYYINLEANIIKRQRVICVTITKSERVLTSTKPRFAYAILILTTFF